MRRIHPTTRRRPLAAVITASVTKVTVARVNDLSPRTPAP